MQLDTNNHSVFMLHYHLIMCVKYRNKVIDDAISERLEELFVKIAPNYNITLEEWNHDVDHVHVLFRGQPNTEISKFINAYKSASSRLIKSATVSQSSDGKYYASVLFTFQDSVITYIPDIDNAIGLDYASDGLYVDNNGNVGSNHKYYRESHKKLAKEQRKLSRKKGSLKNEEKSKNYLKQLRKVNKIHTHIANQRLDNLHKISTEIANRYDVVCVETLNMRAMSNKGFGNGKATLDNGYGMFLSMLAYKLADRGKYLVKVDKWYPSSQICHCCGVRHPEMKDLKIRKMKCACGLEMGRDQNAAINILHEGLRMLTSVA